MSEYDITREIDENMESEEGQKETKQGGKKGGKSKAKAQGSKGVTKRANSSKVSKPRRPFVKLTDEILRGRQSALEERLNVAKAQITIMTSKWQKYEDERMFRTEGENNEE